MRKKDMVFYAIVAVLLAVVLWQWLSASTNSKTMSNTDAYNKQLQYLLAIGPLDSAHLHADIKVYLNGNAVDFSLPKYQLTTNYLHFEDGIGDVVHTHAAGIAMGHIIRGVGGTLTHECLDFEGQKYCNDSKNSLKFYVNGKASSQFDNYVIQDIDKILLSYGPRNENVQQQLLSVTDMARIYSKK